MSSHLFWIGAGAGFVCTVILAWAVTALVEWRRRRRWECNTDYYMQTEVQQ